MSYLINNQQKLNDILFANRNKSYGAYAIRSAYGNTMFKSLSCTILGLSTLISIAYYVSHKNIIMPDITDHANIPEKIYTIPVDLKKNDTPPEEARRRTVQREPGGKTSSAAGIVINDSLITETRTVMANEVVQASVAVTSTLSGLPAVPGGDDAGKGSATVSASGASTNVRGNFEVDSQPEFEGGLAALYRFVSSHLKYPGLAAEEGKEGTVFVKFVVDEKGKVGSLSLLNNLGYGLDDEARRVVTMIPDFKTPAKINGQAVKVYYQLPIKFKMR